MIEEKEKEYKVGRGHPPLDRRFGQPNGNKQGDQRVACKMRAFYRWVCEEATEAELKKFVKDKEQPLMKRKFIQTFLDSHKIKDYIAVTEQFMGKPEQPITMPDNKVNVIFNRGLQD